jgi:hypothetical protein
MARKQRIDSTTAAVRIMQGVTKQMSPPSHVPLDDCDWPFWESVVAEYARAEWSEHQLELAAMLAKDMADAERNRREVRAEGEVLKTEGGKPFGNPRVNVIVAIGNRILATRRSLALHARARAGDNRDAAKQRDHGLGIETDLSNDLLARPVYQ